MNIAKSGILDVNDHVGIYSCSVELEDGLSLREVMLSMPQKLGLTGVDRDETEDKCTQIMNYVRYFTAARDGLNCDLIGSVNAFLERMDGFMARERAMKEILRGLDMADCGCCEAFTGGRKDSADGEELFDRYDRMPYTNLRTEFMTRIGQLNLSAGAVDRMLKELRKSPDCVASAAAYGKDGYELKCLTAMHMCLTRRDISPWQAAANTCLGTDFQAVGDAVRLGRLAGETAGWLLYGSIIAAVILGFELLLSCETAGAFIFSWAAISLVAYSLYWVYEQLPGEAGKAAVRARGLIRRGRAVAAEGWQRIRDRLEGSRSGVCGGVEYDEEELGVRLDSPF